MALFVEGHFLIPHADAEFLPGGGAVGEAESQGSTGEESGSKGAESGAGWLVHTMGQFVWGQAAGASPESSVIRAGNN